MFYYNEGGNLFLDKDYLNTMKKLVLNKGLSLNYYKYFINLAFKINKGELQSFDINTYFKIEENKYNYLKIDHLYKSFFTREDGSIYSNSTQQLKARDYTPEDFTELYKKAFKVCFGGETGSLLFYKRITSPYISKIIFSLIKKHFQELIRTQKFYFDTDHYGCVTTFVEVKEMQPIFIEGLNKDLRVFCKYDFNCSEFYEESIIRPQKIYPSSIKILEKIIKKLDAEIKYAEKWINSKTEYVCGTKITKFY